MKLVPFYVEIAIAKLKI